jgi:hypothetical protein
VHAIVRHVVHDVVHDARGVDDGHDRLSSATALKDRERGNPGTTMRTKKPGREWPPGDSLFSTLFYVAARGGK